MNMRKLAVIYLFCFLPAILLADTELKWIYYDSDSYEEPAGGSFTFLVNPKDNVYAMSLAQEAWIRNTPIFGGAFISLMYNGIETNWYSSLGCTIRVMPGWRIAPFAGGGGAYNLGFYSDSNEDSRKNDSYWSGHVEGGLRLWSSERLIFVEILCRYTWTSLGNKHDYWFAGVATRPGL
jgi:hypothetical protein